MRILRPSATRAPSLATYCSLRDIGGRWYCQASAIAVPMVMCVTCPAGAVVAQESSPWRKRLTSPGAFRMHVQRAGQLRVCDSGLRLAIMPAHEARSRLVPVRWRRRRSDDAERRLDAMDRRECVKTTANNKGAVIRLVLSGMRGIDRVSLSDSHGAIGRRSLSSDHRVL